LEGVEEKERKKREQEKGSIKRVLHFDDCCVYTGSRIGAFKT
jgi:hypothetical protein